MWKTKLGLRRLKVVLVLLGSVLFMASSPTSCDDASFPNKAGTPILADTASLMWSRDGEHLLFSSRGLLGTYVVDKAGRQLRSYPETMPKYGYLSDAGAFAPDLSPDGSRLVYNVFVSGDNIAIETAAFDGSNVRRLTRLDPYHDEEGIKRSPRSEHSIYPVWSPDGTQIAFSKSYYSPSAYRYLYRLHAMDWDGSNTRALAPSIGMALDYAVQSIAWSPDSEWIAFVGIEIGIQRLGPCILYVVRADGSDLTRVGLLDCGVFIGKFSDYSAIHRIAPFAWSPDGDRLAFVGVGADADGTEGHGVFTVQSDGTKPIQVALTEPRALVGSTPLVWSPDGAWLAFVDSRGVNVVRPDGADLRQVANEHAGPVVWTPDGEELLVDELRYAVRPDGSGLREWVSGGVPDVSVMAWSPDGSRLAVLTSPQDGAFRVFTIARDGTDKRQLVRGVHEFAVAENSDWRDVSDDIATCADSYRWSEQLVEDCRTLLSIRNELAGEALLNWSADISIKRWDGIRLHESSSKGVRALNLNWFPPSEATLSHPRLTGMLPAGLGDLRDLEILSFSGQQGLTGRIPPELGKLENLASVDLSNNNLIGCIPKSLSRIRVIITDGLEFCD